MELNKFCIVITEDRIEEVIEDTVVGSLPYITTRSRNKRVCNLLPKDRNSCRIKAGGTIMKNIYEYLGRNVEIIDVDEKSWKGHVSGYYPAGEIEDDEDEFIVLDVPGIENKGFTFYPSEIKSIRELD